MSPVKTKRKKLTSALAKWPPRMTPKRKKAIALLREWAREHQEVECAGGSPVRFLGTIHELHLGDRETSFIFRNDYGVNAFISTDLYDRVEVNEIPGLPTSVCFSSTNPIGGSIAFSPKQAKADFDEKLEQVCAQLRTWIKLNTPLMTQVGDMMRSTISRSVIKEIASGQFIFSLAGTEIIYRAMPAHSDTLQLVREGSVNLVMLFHHRSGSSFVVSDVIESPEDLIARFSGITSRVQ